MTVTFISNDNNTAQSMKTAVPDAEIWKKTQRICFKRGMFEVPRIGESITINNRRYRVVDVIHELTTEPYHTEHKACYVYLEVRGYE